MKFRFPLLKTMEWDDLKYFLAVARTGSVTEAARSLKVGVATVSRRITALERKLHVRLFDRKYSGYSLSESGEAVRRTVEEIEQAVLSVERQVAGRDAGLAGRVRITTGDDIATTVIAPRLPEFALRYPDVSLDIIARFELASLARREADIALRTVRPDEGNYLVRQAGWWELGLYAARTYVQAHSLKPGGINFDGAQVITWNDEYRHMGGARWLAEHAPNARIGLAANSRLIQFAACKAGLGLAVLPSVAADREPDLVCLLPPRKVLSTKLWLVVHRDLAKVARVRVVVDFLASIVPRRSSA
jgi:DNA-binding transcriptional LysR family regulator